MSNDIPEAARAALQAEQFDRGSDPTVKIHRAVLGASFGRLAEATELRTEMEQIDPAFRDQRDLIFISLYAGEYQKTIEVYERLQIQRVPGA